MTGSERRIWRAILTTVVLIAWASVPMDAQCSMCRTLLATPEGERMAAALRSGIWILLAAPFAIFGVVGYAAVKSRRRLAARCNASTQPPGADALSSATEFAPRYRVNRTRGSAGGARFLGSGADLPALVGRNPRLNRRSSVPWQPFWRHGDCVSLVGEREP